MTSQKSKVAKIEKDRLGSAIVSMILGIIAALFIFLAVVVEVITYASGGGLAFVVIAGVVSLVGFPLGLSARKSSRGRGMAIAGITLTVIPFMLVILSFLSTIFFGIASML